MHAGEIDQVDQGEEGDQTSDDDHWRRRDEPRVEVGARAFLQDDHPGDHGEGCDEDEYRQDEMGREHRRARPK